MANPAFRCTVCGYVHRDGAPPAHCPVCGVDASFFLPFVARPLERPTEAEAASSWRCTVCGYVHHGPEAPSRCPVCQAERRFFVAQAPSRALRTPPPGIRVVVLGSGVAGVVAAGAAREASPEAQITIVSAEAGLPYYRINLTRFLAGEVARSDLKLHDGSWYGSERIQTVTGEATTIDREGRTLHLRDGTVLGFERLVLACGAHAFVPAVPGVSRRGVFSFRTLDDALGILEAVRPGTRAVCVGGGLLGLETAAGLARRGASVTVLEGFPYLLPRQLAEPAARRLEAHLAQIGVRVRCGVQVSEILGDEAVAAVRLNDDTDVPADLVVLTTGVRPNSYLARRAGLEVRRGVVVDDHLVSSDPAILAAGDVAEHRGNVHGLWSVAQAQGAVAGRNAVAPEGEPLESFPGTPPATRLKVLDVDVFSAGVVNPPDASFRAWDYSPDPGPAIDGKGRSRFYRLVVHDEQVVGASLFGDTRSATHIQELLESGERLVLDDDTVRSLLDLEA
jgi:nitrite reductase (NADH) large subunit